MKRLVCEAATDWGVYERPCQSGIGYIGTLDPAGGSGGDAMTLCVGHLDYNTNQIIIDCLRERRPPFSPELVASEYSAVFKSYNIGTVYSDRWGGDWPREQFAKFGVNIEQMPKVKNQLYVDLLPCINSGRIRLLDNQRCFNQLISLERSTGRSEIIGHPPGQNDDLINVVAAVASLALSRATFDVSFPFGNRGDWEGDADIKQQPEPPLQTNGGSQRYPTFEERLQWQAADEARRRAEAEDNQSYQTQQLYRRIIGF